MSESLFKSSSVHTPFMFVNKAFMLILLVSRINKGRIAVNASSSTEPWRSFAYFSLYAWIFVFLNLVTSAIISSVKLNNCRLCSSAIYQKKQKLSEVVGNTNTPGTIPGLQKDTLLSLILNKFNFIIIAVLIFFSHEKSVTMIALNVSYCKHYFSLNVLGTQLWAKYDREKSGKCAHFCKICRSYWKDCSRLK